MARFIWRRFLVAATVAILAPTASHADDLYDKPESWLCRPGADDLCSAPIKVAVVRSDGSRETKTFAPNPDALIDCFYVYPTVSDDPNGNSSMTPGAGEKRAVQQQFAPFASVCRPFAPMYRQVTLAGLEAVVEQRTEPTVDPELAYRDVLAAWRHYLEHDNQGRPFVLIGHSQGARLLARLIEETIDLQPEQGFMAGALLLGFNVEVPIGKNSGGTFLSVPVCRAAGESGCVITYETFPASAPPPPDGRFGYPKDAASEVACTDPIKLSGERLDPILATDANLLGQPLTDPWQTFAKPLDAPFVSLPGVAAGRCVEGPDGSYFAVTVNISSKAGAWPATLPGDLVVRDRTLSDWGWHLIDVNVAMGNLIDIVGKMRKPAH